MFHYPFKPLCPLVISLCIAALLGGLVRPMPAIAAQPDIIGPPGSGAFGDYMTVLPNGNIVVTDLSYDAGSVTNVGAVYLYNGATGALISQLTGSTTGDQVGYGGVMALPNGNYLIRSPEWDNGAAVDAGAVTWGSGTAGVAGIISAANRLVGSTTGDRVDNNGVRALTNGNYAAIGSNWNNGAVANAGAVTCGNGIRGVSGFYYS